MQRPRWFPRWHGTKARTQRSPTATVEANMAGNVDVRAKIGRWRAAHLENIIPARGRWDTSANGKTGR
jgi:hypothetical protein